MQAIVEHHLDAKKLGPFKTKQKSLGRLVTATAAPSSGKSLSGTSAGLAYMSKSSCFLHPSDSSVIQEAMGIEDPDYARWLPISIRFKGSTITYIMIYLYTAESLSQRNQQILEQVYT